MRTLDEMGEMGARCEAAVFTQHIHPYAQTSSTLSLALEYTQHTTHIFTPLTYSQDHNLPA